MYRLTLTAASRAYLLEPQWNPSIEEQALARIHRLGQTQEVTTIRFVIAESIEQVSHITFQCDGRLIWCDKYVLDIQDGKRDLISLLSPKSTNSGQVMTKLHVGFPSVSGTQSLTRNIGTTATPTLKSTTTTLSNPAKKKDSNGV